MKKFCWLFLAAAILAVMMAGPASAGDYYKGKKLDMIIPHSPGGGYDTYARTIAPYIAKVLGAEIFPKQATGGGGIRGTNLIWASKPDGLTFGLSSIPSLILTQLSGAEGVQYDATKFTVYGRVVTEPRVFVVGKKSGFKTIEDVIKANRVIKFPSQGLDEDFFAAAVMANALGFKLQQITGYEGNADTALAVVRGDGDGHITGLEASMAMMKDGDKIPVLMFWNERVKGFENVPTALEVTKGEAQNFMKVLVNLIDLHRCYFGPPGVPEAATKEFRDAVAQVMKDPALLKEMASKKMPADFLSGEESQKKLNEVAALAEKVKPVLVQAAKEVK